MLIFLLTFISQSHTCDTSTDATCSSCVGNMSCGWCSASASCVEGGQQGPSFGFCDRRAWYFGNGQNSCPNCSTFSGCTACTDQSGCGWSTLSSTCVASTTVGASPFCPCVLYEQCTDCQRAGCVFCKNTGECGNRTSPPVGCLAQIGFCDCNGLPCEICAEQEDICGWCPSSHSCQKSVELGSCTYDQLTTQCYQSTPFSGGVFFGGIVLGLFLTILAIISYYLYKFYLAPSSQYSEVQDL